MTLLSPGIELKETTVQSTVVNNSTGTAAFGYFPHFLIYECLQLLRCVEMDGLNSNFHNVVFGVFLRRPVPLDEALRHTCAAASRKSFFQWRIQTFFAGGQNIRIFLSPAPTFFKGCRFLHPTISAGTTIHGNDTLYIQTSVQSYRISILTSPITRISIPPPYSVTGNFYGRTPTRGYRGGKTFHVRPPKNSANEHLQKALLGVRKSITWNFYTSKCFLNSK